MKITTNQPKIDFSIYVYASALINYQCEVAGMPDSLHGRGCGSGQLCRCSIFSSMASAPNQQRKRQEEKQLFTNIRIYLIKCLDINLKVSFLFISLEPPRIKWAVELSQISLFSFSPPLSPKRLLLYTFKCIFNPFRVDSVLDFLYS